MAISLAAFAYGSFRYLTNRTTADHIPTILFFKIWHFGIAVVCFYFLLRVAESAILYNSQDKTANPKREWINAGLSIFIFFGPFFAFVPFMLIAVLFGI